MQYDGNMTKQVLAKELPVGQRVFSLHLGEDDCSSLYPGLVRYTLTVILQGSVIAIFRTNTYEYAPNVPLRANDVALEKARSWEQEIRDDPDGFLARNPQGEKTPDEQERYDVVIVQASPRAGGNSGTLARWAEEAAVARGMSCTVLYPHDMDIHECIGCYQCFNTGTCIYDDDMTAIIGTVSRCRLLVLCTPVYTFTVPANLKLILDRFQAYSAARTLGHVLPGTIRGVILSVSGRDGQENFTCVRKELMAFFQSSGILPAGMVLIDGVDRLHDIRGITDCRERVKECIVQSFCEEMPEQPEGKPR